MKKPMMFLLLLMALMTAYSVSGFSGLAFSRIDFTSNHPDFNAPAFVILGVENGGNDVLVWSFNQYGEFDAASSEGYAIDKEGSISSEFTSLGWRYPIIERGSSYRLEQVGGEEFFWLQSSADEWCKSISGADRGITVATWKYLTWICVRAREDSVFHELRQGEPKYNVDYTISVDGQGSDKVTITVTDTMNVGGKVFGNKQWFNVVRQTDGVPPRSDPDIDDKMWLRYDLQTSKWESIRPDFFYQKYSEHEVLQEYVRCNSEYSLRQYECIDEVNANIKTYMDNAFKFVPGVDYGSFSTLQRGGTTGAVKYDDGLIYRNPIVTLTINADKVGIYRTFGNGKIESIDSHNVVSIGQPIPIVMIVKNVGDAKMDATLSFDCPQFSFSGINQRFTLEKGEIKTLSGTVAYIGTVDGCRIEKCPISIQNTNSYLVDDIKFLELKSCQRSECDIEGSQVCAGLNIRECRNDGGVFRWETIKTCQKECSQETSIYAVCKDNTKIVCGDGICEKGERDGESQYCPADCDLKPPACGDGICDGRERKGEEYECLITKTYPGGIKGDCPEDSKPLTDYTMFIFAGAMIAILAIAVFLRLRRK